MSNSLKNEKSPYLRQHAENPVNWYPWGEEAFERARREDKPVFLSIGYSTCHWCHVMAKESFEDDIVADILNRSYISVKVDREERPDIDAVYMDFCLALNGSGGWPLTVIMTPDQKPFFAATYIPRENRGRQIGLVSLLDAIAAKWSGSRSSLLRAGNDIMRIVSREKQVNSVEPSAEHIRKAVSQLSDSYDKEYGGFGKAPKFPSAHNLIFLLRYAKLSGDAQARRQAEHTLQQMYRGGIFDHLGGGFSRYSTDREWLAPHFEKTLYDNALLALAYTEAWQEGHFGLYRYVAESVLDYCLRELQSDSGGFYCGQDADSDGVEGKYYLFTPEEVKSVLGQDAGRHFCESYDITDEGNFEASSIPNLLLNTRWNLLPEGYDDFREKLRIYRASRYPLRTDNKILTSWNGLMLMALSRAAGAFGDRRYLNEAQALADFLEKEMGTPEALYLRSCEGEVRFSAGLDAYAFYALGLLELYDADYDPSHISRAAELAENILSRFADPDGGFYFTAEDSEALVTRPMEIYDGAMPSSNSACAVLFDRLWRMTAKPEWHEAAYGQIKFICSHLRQYPAGCAYGLTALMSFVYPTKELVCAAVGEEVPEVLSSVTEKYAPELTVLLKTPKTADALAEAAPFTAQYAPKDGKAAFYVCSGGECQLPFSE